jgi:hypothetical protein
MLCPLRGESKRCRQTSEVQAGKDREAAADLLEYAIIGQEKRRYYAGTGH